MATQPFEIYEKLSKKYDVPVETVRDVVIWFWRNGVKRSLEGVVNSEIYINRLGSFKIKSYKVPYVIPSVNLLLDKYKDNERNLDYFTGLKDRLIAIQSMIDEKKQRSKEFYELLRANSTDISKQETNLGGPEK